MKSKHPILISLVALAVVLAFLAVSTLRSTRNSSPVASVQHAPSQSSHESDTYAVTRPVRETHKKRCDLHCDDPDKRKSYKDSLVHRDDGRP